MSAIFKSVSFYTCISAESDSNSDYSTPIYVNTLHAEESNEYYLFAEDSVADAREPEDPQSNRKWAIVKPMNQNTIKSMQQFIKILDDNRAILYKQSQHVLGMDKSYWVVNANENNEVGQPPILFLNDRVIIQVDEMHKARPTASLFKERIRQFASHFASQDELAHNPDLKGAVKTAISKEGCCNCIIL